MILRRVLFPSIRDQPLAGSPSESEVDTVKSMNWPEASLLSMGCSSFVQSQVMAPYAARRNPDALGAAVQRVSYCSAPVLRALCESTQLVDTKVVI